MKEQSRNLPGNPGLPDLPDLQLASACPANNPVERLVRRLPAAYDLPADRTDNYDAVSADSYVVIRAQDTQIHTHVSVRFFFFRTTRQHQTRTLGSKRDHEPKL